MLRFEPIVWYGAPGGELQLPGAPATAATVELTSLDLDNPQASPGGSLHFNADPWRFSLGGFFLNEDDRSTVSTSAGQLGAIPFAVGDQLTSSLTFTSVEALVMRKVALPDSINGASGKDFVATLELGGGLRAYDVDVSFAAPAGATNAEEFFLHPLIAAQLSLDIIEQFTVRAAVDMGAFATSGDDHSYAFSIAATFVWHPIKTVGVEIGYRDLAYILQSGSDANRFEYRGAIQGLFAGVELRF